MTQNELARLDVVEAKVDRILTILDDSDFGIRPNLRENRRKIRALEMKVYGLLAGVLGSITLIIVSGFRGA